jgi:GT2 family glycosyltransferase
MAIQTPQTGNQTQREPLAIITCILSYNHPQITERAVKSCLKNVDASTIFLLHNGSEEKHRNYLHGRFPEITHWNLTKNRGYTGGVNELLRRGFEISPWIFLLTNDCELLNRPAIPKAPGFYGPKIWARKVGRVDSMLGKIDLSKAKLLHAKSEADLQTSGAERIYVHGAAFLLHREIFEKIGPFDEGLDTYCEDIDYSLRVAAAGFPLGLEDQIEVLHAIGKTCHKSTHYTTYLFQRNRRRVCLKHCPPEYLRKLRWHLWKENLKTRVSLFLRRKKAQRQLFEQALRDI